jgi:hypothetical protein
LGYVGAGEEALDLKVPLNVKLGGYSSALNKHVAAQWQTRNVGHAVNEASGRFRQANYQLPADRVRADLEAGVFESNRPEVLKMLSEQADHGIWLAAQKQWQERGGPEAGAGLASLQHEHCRVVWKEAERALMNFTSAAQANVVDKNMRKWESPWSKANAAEAVALGTAAAAQSALSAVRRDGKHVPKVDVVRAMCGNHRIMPDLISQVGIATNDFLMGNIEHPVSVGLVGSKHSVLVDLALTAAVNALENNIIKEACGRQAGAASIASQSIGRRLLSWVSSRAERWIANNSFWGPQQGY